MLLYLLRHGEASHDREGPLSDNGKLSIARVAKYFNDGNIRVTKIITSPLLRAWQTAQIVTDHLRLDDKIEESDHLLPESNPDDIIRELLKFNNDEKILLVSH